MKHRYLAVLAGSLAAIAACGGGGGGYSAGSGYDTPTSPGTTTPGANQVIATSGTAFNPATLTVTVGTTVTFTFQTVGHNVFFDPAAGAPGDISSVTVNTSVTRTFSTAGTFGYTCHVHPTMRGTIVVQ